MISKLSKRRLPMTNHIKTIHGFPRYYILNFGVRVYTHVLGVGLIEMSTGQYSKTGKATKLKNEAHGADIR